MIHDDNALHITGGRPLHGDIQVQTAKNSALYLLLAALLSDEPVLLEDVPDLRDIQVMLDMMRHFGAQVERHGPHIYIHAERLERCEAPYHLVSKMRASFVALGPLLGRCGQARMSMPGGCAFGPRPVDRHIKAFRQLGVELEEESGDFFAKIVHPLRGRVVFDAPTVGGTQNVILACALGSERVVIENAALEPEVADLATMLNRMGARIRGAGSATIEIEGVSRLSGIRYRALPDRIEAGTLMLAAAATRSQVTLRAVNADHLRAVMAKLSESGVRLLEIGTDSIVVDARGELGPIDVTAIEYPGVPTDLQAPFGAFLATVPGVSVVEDRVYPERFTHVAELRRMGAQLELRGQALIVRGGSLRGAPVHASDIRAGGALVIAALAARGPSFISGVRYIERGYEAFGKRLQGLGASVRTILSLEGDGVRATGTYGD